MHGIKKRKSARAGLLFTLENFVTKEKEIKNYY